jgi:hypothetical protein
MDEEECEEGGGGGENAAKVNPTDPLMLAREDVLRLSVTCCILRCFNFSKYLGSHKTS